MAFEKIGLGAVLTTDSRSAIKDMGAARNEMGQLVNASNRVPPPLRRIGQTATRTSAKIKAMGAGIARGTHKMSEGVRNLGLGMAPLSLGVGAAISQAASFEKQMSGVGAVSRASKEDMASLSKEARRMGIVSVFSASQAGEGMEFLARAGAKPKEIIAALGGTMNAAAADGISLGQSADIVARVTKGLGKEWSEASHIADVLALASASANTNILSLGESFTYGVATAKQMGISLEEVTAIFAKLADAGLRGSMGGTAFANMMNKLNKPSEKSKKILKKWGIQLTDSEGRLRKLATIVGDFNKKLSGIKSVTERGAIAVEVFGMRGARAFAALAGAGEMATLKLEQDLTKSSEGQGKALEMAKKRLDNFAGSLTLLKSSLEGLSIGFFQPLLKPFATSVRHFTEGFNQVLLALNDINDSVDEFGKIHFPTDKYDDYGTTVVEIAFGLRDAIESVGKAWDYVTEKVRQTGQWLSDTFGASGSLRQIIKFGTLLLIAGAALAPLIAGLVMVKFVVGGLITVFTGLAISLSAVFWPVIVAAAGVLLAWQLLRKENESFLQTSARVWTSIKMFMVDVWENGLKPLWMGFKEGFIPVVKELGQIWVRVVGAIKEVFSDLFEFLFGGLKGVSVDWKEVGRVIGVVIGFIAKTVGYALLYTIKTIGYMAKKVYETFNWRSYVRFCFKTITTFVRGRTSFR
jgi:TP901 family phage tail tape measure protein